MRGFARGSLVVLLVAAAAVLIADVLASGDDRGTVPAELVATIIGAVAVGQLLGSLGRRFPGVWSRRPPLVDIGFRRTDDRAAGPQRPDAVREWDALLVTGSTGEVRGRERLCRRLDTLATPSAHPLVAELRTAQPNQVLELVERFATEVERTHDD
jgi:uncharacterized membrane protein YeaQ/YmgE (transglycosylase-associated protein family)